MSTIQTIMTADESGAELVCFAKRTAKRLVKDKLTRSQIRNIFTEVRKIEAIWQGQEQEALRRLNMLKPKLAYHTARSRSVMLLRDILTNAIIQVDQATTRIERNNRFQRFVDLFEAILAYHRAEGGRS